MQNHRQLCFLPAAITLHAAQRVVIRHRHRLDCDLMRHPADLNFINLKQTELKLFFTSAIGIPILRDKTDTDRRALVRYPVPLP